MASIQVEEERLPASRSHVAMASVMARILSGGGTGERERDEGGEEEKDGEISIEGKPPRTKKAKYSPGQSKISRGDQGEDEEGASRHTGPALADVVRACHRSPADCSIEEERQLQAMATKGGEWEELDGKPHPFSCEMGGVLFN